MLLKFSIRSKAHLAMDQGRTEIGAGIEGW
jgi:hypothetical protein